ncbi:MAG: hypothetical protein PHT93_11855 [Massilibacteroides sp.]|nr:hypothetical protein [Massilibacteroides sp.]
MVIIHRDTSILQTGRFKDYGEQWLPTKSIPFILLIYNTLKSIE